MKGGYAFKSKDYVKDGFPLIRIGDVNRRDFNDSRMPRLPFSFAMKHPSFLVRPGDILMSLTGTTGKDDYGNAVLLEGDSDEYFLNQRVAVIEPCPRIETDYLLSVLQSISVKAKITGLSRGIRQANISNDDILSLPIPLPDIDKQKRFSKVLKQLRVLKQKSLSGVPKLDTLFASLQQRGFKGQL